MFSCLMNMPRVAGGQAPAARASSRIRKRSAASLYGQMWIHWLSGPSSVWPAAANGDNLTLPSIPLGPALDDLTGDTGLHRVGADLVEIAMLARREGRAERRGDHNLALHLDDEFLGLWRPVRDRLGTHAGAVLEVVIGPDVDDAVEWPDFGVKERAERRHLDAFGQCLGPPLLHFRHRSRLQCVGPHLKDHRPHSFCMSWPGHSKARNPAKVAVRALPSGDRKTHPH